MANYINIILTFHTLELIDKRTILSLFFYHFCIIGHFGKYHIILFVCPPKFCVSIVSSFSWDLQWPQEKTKTMLMQNLGGQTKIIIVFSKMAYYQIQSPENPENTFGASRWQHDSVTDCHLFFWGEGVGSGKGHKHSPSQGLCARLYKSVQRLEHLKSQITLLIYI